MKNRYASKEEIKKEANIKDKNKHKHNDLKNILMNNKLAIIIYIILAGLFLGNCFIPYFSIGAFAIVLISVVFCDIKDSLSFIFFSIPFCCLWLPFSVIFLMLCLVAYLIKIFIYNYKLGKLKFSKQLIIALSFLIVFLLFPFKNFYNQYLVIKLLAMLSILILIYLCLNNKEVLRINKNLLVLSIALAIASAYFCLFKNCSEYLVNALQSYSFSSRGFRFTALFTNTNLLALICGLGIGILAFYFTTNNYSFGELFSLLILTVLGLLTFSKTFLIVCCFELLIVLVFAIIHIKSGGWKLLITIVLSISVVLLANHDCLDVLYYRFVGSNGFDHLQSKSFEDIMNVITTGRYDLWVSYFNDMISNPLIIFFGKGLGAPALQNTLSPHNLYISLIYQVGLVGVGLIIWVVVCLIKDAVKISNFAFNKYSIISMLAFALLFVVEDLIFYIY